MASTLTPSPDGATHLAILAALTESRDPQTEYVVHQRACELLFPLLRPTATSAGRFLRQASGEPQSHPASELVQVAETSSSRAKCAYRISRRGRDALHRSLAAPVSLTTSIYGINAFDAKILLVHRYADGKYAGAFLDAQRGWLSEHAIEPMRHGGGILSVVAKRRERERELVIKFLDEICALRKGGSD